MVDYIVVGAGYRGILAAVLLRQKGHRVALVDASNHVGGILFGTEWKSYNLDFGCHLFDNSNPDYTDILKELFGELMVPVDLKYAGRTCQHWHENFTVPSLVNSPIDKTQLLFELVNARASTEQRTLANYKEYLIDRFGPAAAEVLAKACIKKMHYDPAELDPIANRVVSFDRIQMFEHDFSMYLKRLPDLNDVLAAYNIEDPMYFYPGAKSIMASRNFYPLGGTNKFCQRAKQYLTEIGVDLYLNHKISFFEGNTAFFENGNKLECNKLIWTLELEKVERLFLGSSELEKYIHPVPMVMVYFEVPYYDISDYTYIHDHSDDTAVFRCSSIGKYSQQIIDGKSFICCEIPTKIDSQYWQNPNNFIEQFWLEAKLMRIVRTDAMYSDYKILKAPVTFKLPKIGFSSVAKDVIEKLACFETLILTDSNYFSPLDIVKLIHAEIENL